MYPADSHTCALDQDDGLWCWGNHDEGQLGDGTAWAVGAEPVALP